MFIASGGVACGSAARAIAELSRMAMIAGTYRRLDVSEVQVMILNGIESIE
jgi:hypothetical protein